MTTAIVVVFFLVYLGMILGGLPFLQLDRTGVALLGAIALIGSIANIIVVDAAARCGVPIDWRAHARVGVPVTVTTLAIVAVYMAARM